MVERGITLIVLSRRLFDKITKLLDIPVSLAMRYGSITIKKGIQELEDNGVKDILVLPLYPHYAMSSYETVVEKVKEEVYKNFPNIKIDIVPPFYNNSNYIDLLSSKFSFSIKDIEYFHILFSYHGIPESHIQISDVTKNTLRYRTLAPFKVEATMPLLLQLLF